MTATRRRIRFHRRSSVGLPSVDSDSDNDSENETEQENELIKNPKTIVSSSPTANSSMVNNEK